MIFEAGFWLALVAASRAIAKIYYRRRDVLYGPYIGMTEGSKIGIQRSWIRFKAEIGPERLASALELAEAAREPG
jgi:hypothetical protein